jgi:hypothetical protein
MCVQGKPNNEKCIYAALTVHEMQHFRYHALLGPSNLQSFGLQLIKPQVVYDGPFFQLHGRNLMQGRNICN